MGVGGGSVRSKRKHFECFIFCVLISGSFVKIVRMFWKDAFKLTEKNHGPLGPNQVQHSNKPPFVWIQ